MAMRSGSSSSSCATTQGSDWRHSRAVGKDEGSFGNLADNEEQLRSLQSGSAQLAFRVSYGDPGGGGGFHQGAKVEAVAVGAGSEGLQQDHRRRQGLCLQAATVGEQGTTNTNGSAGHTKVQKPRRQ